MIITVNHKKIKEALGITERIITKNLSLPILQNLLLETDQGRLKISSTNLEIGISSWVGAKIEEEGGIIIPARIFFDFISNIQSEKITIRTKENIITVDTDNHKTKIIGFMTGDFPIIPKSKSQSFISLEAREFSRLLATVIESSSLSETRPELAGVFLNFSAKSLEAAATDSFRLAEKKIEVNSTEEQNIILPRYTAQELIRILGEREEKIEISISDNQIFIATPELAIVSRLIDGHYPDYKKVIPQKSIASFLTKKDELERNVKLASVFSSTMADIKIQATKDSLKVLAKNSDKGEIDSVVPGILKNSPFSLAINFRYLLDGLKIIPTNQVVIEFTGEGSPLILRPEGQKNIIYLIMPLRS